MKNVRDVESIIDALGGDAAVVELFGCVRTTPFNWRANSYFPADTYWVIQEELKKRGASCGPNAQRTLWNWRSRASNGSATE